MDMLIFAESTVERRRSQSDGRGAQFIQTQGGGFFHSCLVYLRLSAQEVLPVGKYSSLLEFWCPVPTALAIIK